MSDFTVSLTFDNGPHPDITPHVLDVLAARDLKATFFVIGENAINAEYLLDRAHDEGHWIGNHTWSHSVPLGHQTGPNIVEAEVERTQRLIGERAHPRKLFRPFGSGGLFDRRLLRSDVRDHLVAENYTCVLWNVVPGDWADPDTWPEIAIKQCKNQTENLVVLHDILMNGAMKHLERFLDMIVETGGKFTQEIPDDTIIIEGGKVRPGAEKYVTPYKPEDI